MPCRPRLQAHVRQCSPAACTGRVSSSTAQVLALMLGTICRHTQMASDLAWQLEALLLGVSCRHSHKAQIQDAILQLSQAEVQCGAMSGCAALEMLANSLQAKDLQSARAIVGCKKCGSATLRPEL